MTTPDTLPALLDTAAADFGSRPVLIEDGVTTSFEDLAANASLLAAGFAARGIGTGTRVALWLPNRIDWLVCLFALARLRAIAVSVNTRFRTVEVEDIVGRAGCEALVYEPGFKGIDFDGILREADKSALSRLRLVVGTRKAPDVEVIPGADTAVLEDLKVGPPHQALTARADDGAIVFTTSGTTSKPKFVLHTQASLSRHAGEVARAFNYVAADTVLLQALPLCGTFGLSQVLAGIAAGRPTVNMSVFDAAEAVRLIAQHKVTTFNGSDEMLSRICAAAEADELASIKWCGFASFSSASVEELLETWAAAGIKAAGLYGMSEVQALYARQPLDADTAGRALGGGVLTSPDAAVEVRDPDTGAVLPYGETGELFLKGPSRMKEYMDNPSATRAGIGSDGFVRSGDLGHMIADRHFVFETRMGDGIRLGGFLVNPAEIDAWLERHPQVAACQTVGIAISGQTRPVSFVVAQPGANISQQVLTAHCREGLASFKVPEHIVQLEEFPTTDGPNGKKIQRSVLRTIAQERFA